MSIQSLLGIVVFVAAAASARAQSWSLASSPLTLGGAYTAPFGAPVRPLATADLDFDGDTDLLLVAPGTAPAGLVTVLNIGGAFILGPFIPTAAGPTACDVGDIDADGDPDFVAYNGATVTVIKNFVTTVSSVSLAAAAGADRVRLLDLDGDGDRDILLGRAQKFINSGSGTFGAATALALPFTIPANAGGIRPLEAGDFNADGLVDLALAYELPGASGGYSSTAVVEIFSNLGGAAFGAPLTVQRSVNFLKGFAVGDFDGDGRADFAISEGNSGGCAVTKYRSIAGAFAFWAQQAIGLVNAGLGLLASDVNADGDADLFSFWDLLPGTRVYVEYGGPSVPAPASLVATVSNFAGVIDCAVADFGGSNRKDLLMTLPFGLAGVLNIAIATNPTGAGQSQPAWILDVLSGQGQIGVFGSSYAQPLVARVRDAVTNAGIPSIPITAVSASPTDVPMTFAAGAASVTVQTNANGLATISPITLGVPASITATSGPLNIALSSPGLTTYTAVLNRSGLIAQNTVVSGTGTAAVRFDYPSPGLPFVLGVNVPQPPPGFTIFSGKEIWTSVLAPAPSLLVLDGLGLFGPPNPAIVLDATGTWSLAATYPVAALAGVTLVFQAYAYDPAVPPTNAVVVSNPRTINF